MSIFGKDARKKTCHDDEDEDKDDKSRVFYAALSAGPISATVSSSTGPS